MKASLVLIGIMLIAFSCTKPNHTPEGPTDVRIRNVTDQDFTDVFVDTGGGSYNYGNIASGTETGYHRFDKAYPDAEISVLIEGEEYTISGDYLAYQDMGVPLGIENFEGVQRDGIPAGNRIFRMPYFDPDGNMTIMQWNTAKLGVDYRIGPRETKTETFTFQLPFEAAPGDMTITAQLNYQLLVKPVADFLHVPAEESEIKVVNTHSTHIEVLP